MSDKRKQFVDTNILVYAHDTSAGEKYKKARELIENLWNTGEGCLSIQVLQELYVTLVKKVSSPLESNIAASIISDLGKWSVHVPGVDDILEAIKLQQQYCLSFWDAMIMRSTQQMNCDILLSEDLNTNQIYEGVKVINPFI